MAGEVWRGVMGIDLFIYLFVFLHTPLPSLRPGFEDLLPFYLLARTRPESLEMQPALALVLPSRR